MSTAGATDEPRQNLLRHADKRNFAGEFKINLTQNDCFIFAGIFCLQLLYARFGQGLQSGMSYIE